MKSGEPLPALETLINRRVYNMNMLMGVYARATMARAAEQQRMIDTYGQSAFDKACDRAKGSLHLSLNDVIGQSEAYVDRLERQRKRDQLLGW